jgi:hypothetical protein
LVSVPESALLAEFPSPDQARRVLEAVGSGERTQANIAAAAGARGNPIPSGALSPLLRRLVEEKRVLAVDEPLSTKPQVPGFFPTTALAAVSLSGTAELAADDLAVVWRPADILAAWSAVS